MDMKTRSLDTIESEPSPHEHEPDENEEATARARPTKIYETTDILKNALAACFTNRGSMPERNICVTTRSAERDSMRLSENREQVKCFRPILKERFALSLRAS